MKHGVTFRKLGRDSAHRWSLLRNLVTQLIKHDRIITTVPKAKELRRVADKMVTFGKRGDLHARRFAAGIIQEKALLPKLFGEMAQRYLQRAGGYTRVLRIGNRHGDNAPMAIIEFVDSPNEIGLRATETKTSRESQL